VKLPQGRWLLAGICALYLLLVVALSLMIPAYEANDEPEHVRYVERIVLHGQLPAITLANGYESHQPPLYYLLASVWQRVLHIEAFEPQAGNAAQFAVVPGRPTRALMFTHDYTPEQRRHAIAVHALRVISILLGLATVLLTYAAAKVASGREDLAAGAAAFVALLPKFQVVSATFTNDALAITLSSLLLLLALAVLRTARPLAARAGALALGAVAGAALVTKLNTAPVLAAAVVALILAARPLREKVLHLGLFGVSFLLVSGWWFLRNNDLYGEYLARETSRDYLRSGIPGLIDPVSLLDADRFLYFLPETLFRSVWYAGGWNQFFGPFALNLLLWMVVGAALFVWARSILAEPREAGWTIGRREAVSLSLFALAGLVAVVIVALDTTQAEGRVALVGLSAFAIAAVAGLEQAVGGSARARAAALAAFPALLLAYDAYVLTRYVIPFRGL
jgi:4-amino-4-deoxy-L-arabinose transferase-like glycosyltransferase